MASGEGDGEGWEAAVRAEVGAVGWWDDPDSVDLRARFKAFTGQRRDWPEPTLLFWKDLLLRVARRLRLCSAPAHLEEMRADGDILLKSELIDPSTGSLYQLVRRVSKMAISSRRPVSQEDILVFKSLVEEDAHAVLCFLTQSGKARYLLVRKQDPIDGVKFSLNSAQVPAVSKLDHDTLHLVWTEEKLQQQLDVYEAIQIGIQAMKENNVSIEEVNVHLKEVDELVAAQREVDAALESAPLLSVDGEGDIEEEFRKLEAELHDKIPHIQVQESMSQSNEESPDDVVESLSNNLSSIKLEAI
ncbi:hypothetical protein BAE44_0009728 [Dichanthelium oligosanthes]|uniref:Charged multivesicular body protein 7 n=1 Tax=Dichanthelium oligosanthes TaxID=888268 RepID=A0A1E5VVU4_9POAL|nr:hypothetical protein BAE44_0009728 [Dichanthelium oligosanthes]